MCLPTLACYPWPRGLLVSHALLSTTLPPVTMSFRASQTQCLLHAMRQAKDWDVSGCPP